MAAAVMLSWGDLRHDTSLQAPMWMFDADRIRVAWDNAADGEFWRAASLQQLQARDDDDASTATRARLHASMQRYASGRVLGETWTLHPLGQPLSTALLSLRGALHQALAPLQLQAEQRGLVLDWQVSQPFVQADDSITRRDGGTGLGLSIASHLVRLMGGRLEATSQPGQGGCFGCEVQLQRLPGADDAQQAH